MFQKYTSQNVIESSATFQRRNSQWLLCWAKARYDSWIYWQWCRNLPWGTIRATSPRRTSVINPNCFLFYFCFRWRPTVKLERFEGLNQHLHKCIQGSGPSSNITDSEDCLTMNIFRPKIRSDTDSFPIMIYFHGGSHNWGSSHSPLYDGSQSSFQSTPLYSDSCLIWNLSQSWRKLMVK